LAKDLLKDEINNIALKIVKVRETKNNMRYNPDTGKLEGAWKVPEVESMNRKYNECERFYNINPNIRPHGVKFVPPPVAENLQQLRSDPRVQHMGKGVQNDYELHPLFRKERA
jgi:hypothetical protein